MNKLKALRIRQADLLKESIAIQTELHQLKKDVCFEEYGVRAGSVVKDLSTGIHYTVSEVKPMNGLKPSLYCQSKEKQDRCIGVLTKPIMFQWEVVKK